VERVAFIQLLASSREVRMVMVGWTQTELAVGLLQRRMKVVTLRRRRRGDKEGISFRNIVVVVVDGSK
jgi:hypothetical protein